jgi:superfamily II DNA or RNA helicase
MEWMSDGRRRHADFTVVLPAAESARRLRTALDPEGEWVKEVLRDADVRLSQIRAGDHPDAGGLVIAADKEHADRLAARLEHFSGVRPPIVTSDDPQASKRIAAFAAGTEPWLVSVLMVSEGVDIPRLRVGVYATAARTELFFRQVVGRFIRRTPGRGEQMSWLFLPSDPKLKELAATVEEERNHALVEDLPGELGEEPREIERGERDDAGFHALSSTARLDDELLQTTAPGEQMGLFGGPPAPAAPALAPVAPTPVEETAYERRERLREERQALVAEISRRTGEPYRSIHARINQATGVTTVAKASIAQLEKGNARLERELAKR